MTFQAIFKTAAVTGLALAGSSAMAHVGADGAAHHGLVTGFLHPVTGLDHLAAMLAVGVWSAMTTRRIWMAPVSFAALLLTGALLAQAGVGFPAIEPMIAVSMLVVGLLLAVQVKLPDAAGAVLVGAFALFHGAAHGQELGGGAALVGMVLGTAVLHAVGIGMGLGLKRAHAWLPRAAGAGVALMGLNMGWGLLAG
jgi:urease accessory protein